MSVLTLGSGLAALLAAFLLWMIADAVREVRSLRKYQKILRGEAMPGEAGRTSMFTRGGTKRLIGKLVKLAMVAFFIVCVFRSAGLWLDDTGRVPLADCEGELPFATVRDLGGAGAYDYELSDVQYVKSTNTMKEDSDWIAPRVIDYNENASVMTSSGQKISSHLYLDYYEMKNEWLAKCLAKELYRSEKRDRNFEPMEVSLSGSSDEVIYSFYSSLHAPTVIITKGNAVIKAMFFQLNSEETVALENWVKAVAEH